MFRITGLNTRTIQQKVLSIQPDRLYSSPQTATMYEDYVGKAANITLSDGRFVKGTIVEVLDAVGSMKLSDVRIFKTPNDIPRELVSFAIPGNRIQEISVDQQGSQPSSPSTVDNVEQTPSIASPMVPESGRTATPLDILLGSPIRPSSDMSSTPRSLSSPMSPNIVSDNDIPNVVENKPPTPVSKPTAKIPSFAAVRPHRARDFVETVEIEYGDLWTDSRSPASNRSPSVKGKKITKQGDASPNSQTLGSPITMNSPTPQIVDHHHNHHQQLQKQLQQQQQQQQQQQHGSITADTIPDNQPAINGNTASKRPANPKVDQSATNLLLANLNIANGRPTPASSVPKTNVPENSLKKLPSFTIPAGLIPPKARRKESADASIPQSPEKKRGAQTKATMPTTPPVAEVPVMQPAEKAPPQAPTTTIRTVSEGQECPLVQPSLMKTVHAMCDSESGPNNIMIMESAGVSAAMMALKAIGGQRRIQPNNHNAAPLVVVLAGNNNYTGAYGLAAARHLLNRGCQVVVCIAASNNASIAQRIASQEYIIQLAGGRIVKRVEDLPQQLTTPVDIIIDALLGSQTTFADLKSDYESFQIVIAAMDWANSNKAPVLSIDFPSGVDPIEGMCPFRIGEITCLFIHRRSIYRNTLSC
ncbi:hypothetical protein K450DRAFT_261305 [Umbelopsis ramanniana AG]|uniref:YjeF N-terminal domain-containing protein n=1 Tax=Umbelopsis ramanniana AG TaxID=1314678 RepID=A0AAD5E4M5_UMBRA|nr:uncharacterized protein K450DRAFT_261305 [Umbelopsis ramanniana AG]KAI8575515.1 hypothetical protein K450DRAFT_261305 [Umbelopsis ramanniana AG]